MGKQSTTRLAAATFFLFACSNSAIGANHHFSCKSLKSKINKNQELNKFPAQQVQSCLTLAQAGNIQAQYYLGEYYLGRDHEQSANWLIQAASKNHATAQRKLASLFAKGLGVKKDYDSAIRWYQRAADNQDAHAQFFIATHYELGVKLKKNQKQAIYWYQQAAEQGHVEAQYFLGSIYVNGSGTSKNVLQGAPWLISAAAKGHCNAALDLADLFANGRKDKLPLYAPKNAQAAQAWYEKARQCNQSLVNPGQFIVQAKSTDQSHHVGSLHYKILSLSPAPKTQDKIPSLLADLGLTEN